MSIVVTKFPGAIYNDNITQITSTSFTVTGWANYALTIDDSYSSIVSIANAISSDTANYTLYINPSNDLEMTTYDGVVFTEESFLSKPKPDTWFYYAITCAYNGEGYTLRTKWCTYEDTSFSLEQEVLLDAFDFSTSVVIVGSSSAEESAINSMFSQTRLWSVNLSDAQILNEKNRSAPFLLNGLVFSWPLLTQTDDRDQSKNNIKPKFISTTLITPGGDLPPYIQRNLNSGPQSQPSFNGPKPIDDNTTFVHPQVSVRWSNNGGNTYGNWITKEIGQIGQYDKQVKFYNCGQGRNRVFDVLFTDPVVFNIIGAQLDAEVNRD